MNQLYRALHIPPKRLLRKLSGEKEIYTIAVRPVPKAEGTDPLPALGGTPYTMLPARPGFWYADPLLYHRDGRRWLYAEAMDLATGLGRIEVCELHDDIYLRTFVISAPLQYIFQRQNLYGGKSCVNRRKTVYGSIRFHTHEDIQLLQC